MYFSKSHRVGGDAQPMLLKQNYVSERKNAFLAIDNVMFAFYMYCPCLFLRSFAFFFVPFFAIENVVL